jgi:predicted nucleic acid-binding protein
VQAVLVDTTVWIRLFRGDPEVRGLIRLLASDMAHIHLWSLGELLLGSGIPREYLETVTDLPRIQQIEDDDALSFLGEHRLHRSGIGWVDLRILACAHRRGIALWTFDDALSQAARDVQLPKLRPENW